MSARPSPSAREPRRPAVTPALRFLGILRARRHAVLTPPSLRLWTVASTHLYLVPYADPTLVSDTVYVWTVAHGFVAQADEGERILVPSCLVRRRPSADDLFTLYANGALVGSARTTADLWKSALLSFCTSTSTTTGPPDRPYVVPYRCARPDALDDVFGGENYDANYRRRARSSARQLPTRVVGSLTRASITEPVSGGRSLRARELTSRAVVVAVERVIAGWVSLAVLGPKFHYSNNSQW
ncbi:hypothetical protein DFH09DRAFT_1335102 [Mycena vulgaris]|nr:hypothetical protein DFH09DRAFT_1335102 [Mycena vulgaris]